mgnify:CR=1 FL=1
MLDGGAFTMQGGEISGNTVGVHVKSGDLTLGGKAKITDNPAADAGVKQNILLAANQKIRFDSLDPSAKFGISVAGESEGWRARCRDGYDRRAVFCAACSGWVQE